MLQEIWAFISIWSKGKASISICHCQVFELWLVRGAIWATRSTFKPQEADSHVIEVILFLVGNSWRTLLTYWTCLAFRYRAKGTLSTVIAAGEAGWRVVFIDTGNLLQPARVTPRERQRVQASLLGHHLRRYLLRPIRPSLWQRGFLWRFTLT